MIIMIKFSLGKTIGNRYRESAVYKEVKKFALRIKWDYNTYSGVSFIYHLRKFLSYVRLRRDTLMTMRYTQSY